MANASTKRSDRPPIAYPLHAVYEILFLIGCRVKVKADSSGGREPLLSTKKNTPPTRIWRFGRTRIEDAAGRPPVYRPALERGQEAAAIDDQRLAGDKGCALASE